MSPVLTHPVARTAVLLSGFVALALALALAGGPVETSEARGSGCGKNGVANKRSDRVARSGARFAVKCLINAERSARSLKLRPALNRAAQRHSTYMARHRCFSHQCPGELGTEARIRRAGYLKGARSYRIGEVIALNRGKASARDVVRQWKNSGGHRAQILSSGYRHMGVGVVARRGKAFYTVTLGAKSR